MSQPFWKNKKVVVTGHEGFLGSWLTKTLLSHGAEVIGLDKVLNRPHSVLNGRRQKLKAIQGDITHYKFVKDFIDSHKPSYIFHLAAETIVREANRNPIKTFKTNIQGVWNILEACRGKDFIKGIIVASSDKAYGSHPNLPYQENFPLNGRHPYDVSKSCTDLLCKSYYNTYRVPVCVTRCGNIYGPGDFHYSRIVPDAIVSVIKKRPLIIRSDGKYTRDYIYVEDVVSGCILLAQQMHSLKLTGEAFNFSQEKPLSVVAIFNKIVKLTKEKRIAPKILNQAVFEIRDQYLSSKKAKTILKWEPRFSLEKGLLKTIAWYRRHG